MIITAGSAWAADSIPANQSRDQQACYQSALTSSAATRPANPEAFVNWAYYGCMKQLGYNIPANAVAAAAGQYASASKQAPVQTDAVTSDSLVEAGLQKEINSLGLKDHDLYPLSID